METTALPQFPVGNQDSANTRKSLARCSCSKVPQTSQNQLREYSQIKAPRKLKDSNELPVYFHDTEKEEPTAVGTGVYFRKIPCDCSLDCSCHVSELQNLFNLATVACNVESSEMYRQTVKKRRRTRRDSSWSTDTRLPDDLTGLCLPGASTEAQPRTTGLRSSSWLKKSLHKRRDDVKLNETIHSIVHCRTKSKTESCHPTMRSTENAIEFNWSAKRSRFPAKLAAKEVINSRIRTTSLSKKETRVQVSARRVLQFVGERSIEEKFIRVALGNNPDTSKALRLLLKQNKIHRIGDGGRGKAYLYKATPAGLGEAEELRRCSSGTP